MPNKSIPIFFIHRGPILVLFMCSHSQCPLQMMQKLGKSDQTKDEVFEDFVANFNRQSVSISHGPLFN